MKEECPEGAAKCKVVGGVREIRRQGQAEGVGIRVL